LSATGELIAPGENTITVITATAISTAAFAPTTRRVSDA
jgi:hypothetical protein